MWVKNNLNSSSFLLRECFSDPDFSRTASYEYTLVTPSVTEQTIFSHFSHFQPYF